MRGRKFTEDLRWAAICAQHHGLNPIATSSSCISAFPALQEWFASIDGDPTRCIRGNEYSQYSHMFDPHGFKSLLDLEGVGPHQLFDSLVFQRLQLAAFSTLLRRTSVTSEMVFTHLTLVLR